MSKKAIITIGGGKVNNVIREPVELYQSKTVKVFEKEHTGLIPKGNNNNKRFAYWVSEGQNTPVFANNVNIVVPANSQITLESSLIAEYKIESIMFQGGSNVIVDGSVANVNVSNQYERYCEVDGDNGDRVLRIRENGSTYVVDLVQVNNDGTFTILDSADTGINRYNNQNARFGAVKVNTNKYVFFGKDTNLDYTRYRVFEIVNNTINWLGADVNIYDGNNGSLERVIAVRDDYFVREDNSGTTVFHAGNTVTKKNSSNGTLVLGKIGNGYFVGADNNGDRINVFYVDNVGNITLKKQLQSPFNTNDLNGAVMDDNELDFYVNGQEPTSPNYYDKILKLRYDPNNNDLIKLAEYVHKSSNYGAPRGIHKKGNVVFLFTAISQYNLGYVQLDRDLNVVADWFNIYMSTDYNIWTTNVSDKILVMEAWTGTKNALFDLDGDGLFYPRTVRVLEKRLNSVPFDNWQDIVGRHINDKKLIFEFDVLNERDEDIILPINTSKYLYLMFE